VSTSAQATLGGMAGNNSCGSRSIAYGNMVHNVLAAQAWTPTASCTASSRTRTASGQRRELGAGA
jgi:FAD/FMN-containing dehydrogenase